MFHVAELFYPFNARALLQAVMLPALVLAIIVGATAPASAEAPARYMQRVAKELQSAARSGGKAAFQRVIRKHADYPDLGLYSLGSYRGRLKSSDRSSYYSGMIKFIARYAANEAPKYPLASAVVTGQTGETKRGAYVDSVITLKNGTQYDVRWKVVRRGKGWKVRDAEVVGFWMSPFLKDLFEKYIGENGGNPKALVYALNQ